MLDVPLMVNGHLPMLVGLSAWNSLPDCL